ncbi:transcriptional regulator [Pedobacter lusitanus]|uniref:Transcriptional regulator n=1 Tax=Pedobacter lusitanus TaxID=1503925 RepID=A0A0D0GDW5_9SPHI|nr:LytTR family DNA-binding domain-containing protein [Pedobacter lusitanus]KIO75537.1 transcriptional regulator [Pedobacter lusitanus]
MLKCVIIDDEPHAIEGLKNYLAKIPELELTACYTDPLLAINEINKGEEIDLLLLDIDMPEISGIELAGIVQSKIRKLVFTTAHVQYGYEAFEKQADGYLLKPYSFAKFLTTIHKLFPAPAPDQTGKTDQQDFFFIKSKDDNLKLIKILYDDIILAESKLNYVMVYAVDKSILTYISLTEISFKLTRERGFEQFHRSFIMNNKHIDHIDGNTITMNNGRQITVGDHYKKDFSVFVNRNLLKARRKL